MTRPLPSTSSSPVAVVLLTSASDCSARRREKDNVETRFRRGEPKWTDEEFLAEHSLAPAPPRITIIYTPPKDSPITWSCLCVITTPLVCSFSRFSFFLLLARVLAGQTSMYFCVFPKCNLETAISIIIAHSSVNEKRLNQTGEMRQRMVV